MDVNTMSDLAALLERFRRGPELLAVVLTGVFGEEEDFVAAPGKWSIRQIVAHVADAEMVGAHRFRQVIADEKVGKLSVVGVGMRSHPGVAAKMFETLAQAGINIDMISTSEIKISVVIDLAKGEQAVKAVHAAFIG